VFECLCGLHILNVSLDKKKPRYDWFVVAGLPFFIKKSGAGAAFATLAFFVFFTAFLLAFRLHNWQRKGKVPVKIDRTDRIFFDDMFLLTH
jgi:hypothetical protein